MAISSHPSSHIGSKIGCLISCPSTYHYSGYVHLHDYDSFYSFASPSSPTFPVDPYGLDRSPSSPSFAFLSISLASILVILFFLFVFFLWHPSLCLPFLSLWLSSPVSLLSYDHLSLLGRLLYRCSCGSSLAIRLYHCCFPFTVT